MGERVEGTHTFHLSSELSANTSLKTRPLHGCVRNTTEVAFCCYSRHGIERVPVKIGDVRVPFVV